MSDEIDMKTMIADYMEKGFLENIVDMFKRDRGLYPLIGDLMKDDRMRVRLGISALVETLAKEDAENITAAIPSIAGLLNNQNPTIRGDAAYLLGITGNRDAIPFLSEALRDEHHEVRDIAREAIDEIKSLLGKPEP
jgi:HEAT repeat protein